MAVASVGEKVEEGKLCSRKKRPKVKSMFRIGRDDRTRRGGEWKGGEGVKAKGCNAVVAATAASLALI